MPDISTYRMTLPFKMLLSAKQYLPLIVLIFLLGCQKPEPEPVPKQLEKQLQQEEPVDLSLLCKNIEKYFIGRL